MIITERRPTKRPATERAGTASIPVAISETETHPTVPLVRAEQRPMAVRYLWAKRLIDRPAALILVVLLAPVFAAVALLIRLRSPGPVFFKHRRVGLHGKPFHCLKFRTMHVDAEERLRSDPELWERFVANGYKLKNDPRVIPMGKLLRKSSVDELPQLLNVLRGEMSLVGPRPIIEPELKEYGAAVSEFLSVLPGMTGRWQSGGQVPYPERVDVELGYVHQWSVWEDLRILLRTVPVIVWSCVWR